MVSIRQKNLSLIMLWSIASLLIFSNQARGYQCSPEVTDDLITYGDTVTCKIDTTGDIDKFRFSGSNGDTVVVQATRQGGGNPCIELFGPDGVRINIVCHGSAARIDATLDQTGTHTILVTEWGNDAPMDYALALERIMPPSAFATPINPSDPPLTDVIDPVGDLDLFFFQGSDGDTVVVQATRQGGGNPCIELFDPDGVRINIVCHGSAARIDATLDQTGTHAILVTEWGNDATMDYALAYECIGTCPTALDEAEIIGTWSSGIWYLDVASSKWTRMTSSPPTGDIAAGDFTGDGKADVASIWSSGLWYQDGVSLAWTKVGSAPDSVTAGDVTGDGHDEIIGAWSNGIWYWDEAVSKWTRMTSSTPTGDIAAGDFTGDGIADVASCWDSGLWYQDGVTLAWIKVSSAAPGSVTAGDVTGDGQAEIIGTWVSGIRYWDVAESEWTKMSSSMPSGDITAGDFNGDGIADVASCWDSGLWYQDGDTLGWTEVSKTAPYTVTAGDVTGD